MFSNLKLHLRRRLLGGRFHHRLVNDSGSISRLWNFTNLAGYSDLLAPGHVPAFNDFEFSYYSQNGEDGLILYLLSKIGADNHYVMEIGTQDGHECNSANLILNFGWRGCLIEADQDDAEKARNYFDDYIRHDKVKVLGVEATVDNINDLIREAGVPENIDVLSIDIDSYDYWLWAAIDACLPRIVVIEYNASFGSERSVTIPHKISGKKHFICYHGASITALARLGKRKGYVLVGCDSQGVNAFFVRGDLTAGIGLQAVDPKQAFRSHFRRSRKMSDEQQFKTIAGLPLQAIDED